MGSPNQGTLSLAYDSTNGAVSLTCKPTTLYMLTVSVAAGDGYDSIVSSPAGIDCGPNVTNSVCSAPFPIGYSITLGAQPSQNDILTGWSGGPASVTNGQCPASVNVDHPYPGVGQPTPSATINNSCTFTMGADTSISGSFAGVMRIENVSTGRVNFVPGSLNKATMMEPSTGTNSLITDVIPYGTAVTVTAVSGQTLNFQRMLPCTAAQGATLTSTNCAFTMIPGDATGLFQTYAISS